MDRSSTGVGYSVPALCTSTSSRPQAVGHLRGDGADLRIAAQVAHGAVHPVAVQGLDQRVQRGGLAVQQQQPRALRGERPRQRLPDAAGRAGDQHGAAFQTVADGHTAVRNDTPTAPMKPSARCGVPGGSTSP